MFILDGTKSQISLKNWVLPMFKKPQNLKGLTVNLVQRLFNLKQAGGGRNPPTGWFFPLLC